MRDWMGGCNYILINKFLEIMLSITCLFRPTHSFSHAYYGAFY